MSTIWIAIYHDDDTADVKGAFYDVEDALRCVIEDAAPDDDEEMVIVDTFGSIIVRYPSGDEIWEISNHTIQGEPLDILPRGW